MKLTDIDLNLLLVFHQLMLDQRVSRAADSLGLSQPAVSNALRRLRNMLGDELFLRTPQGMAPTLYAQSLAAPVALALEGLQHALNVRASFDPTGSDRSFTLAMTDVGEIYFLPVLMHALAREAPGVTLRCVPVADTALRENMASGRVDLALAAANCCELARAGHALKALAGNVGAVGVVTICSQLEAHATRGRLAEAREQVWRLHLVWGQTHAVIEPWC